MHFLPGTSTSTPSAHLYSVRFSFHRLTPALPGAVFLSGSLSIWCGDTFKLYALPLHLTCVLPGKRFYAVAILHSSDHLPCSGVPRPTLASNRLRSEHAISRRSPHELQQTSAALLCFPARKQGHVQISGSSTRTDTTSAPAPFWCGK